MLEVRDLAHGYPGQPVFQGVGLSLAAGESVAVVGASGVGKSTLLQCMAGLERWQHGDIRVAGLDIGPLDDEARARWRREHVGFVFQAFHLLPYLSVFDNVHLPLLLLGQPNPKRVSEMLQAVGLQQLGARLPEQLSGGQMQRVAIARALVHQPALLLADEPTGNLDPAHATEVLELLLQQSHAHAAALVLVTHNLHAAQRANRALELTPTGLHPWQAASSTF
ncbi:MAG: ABC transporter ATP-binding protein [Burkholderiaceae bacterium]